MGGRCSYRSGRRGQGTQHRPQPFRRADLKLYVLQHPHSGDPDALFWPARSNGSRRLDFYRNVDCGSVLQYYMRPLLPGLGLPPKMRWHDLRHTYASLMLAAGIPPYKVSRWMGHASLVTTDTVYSHLYPSDYSAEIAQFEAFTSGAVVVGDRLAVEL